MGNAQPPVNEDSIPRPISPYGASKLAGEGYCSAFAEAYDMRITATRFANVVGPISAHKKGAVTVFIRALMNDTPITIYGDGEATRDFLYVDDLCRGILAAMEKNLPGFNVFHLANGFDIIKPFEVPYCAPDFYNGYIGINFFGTIYNEVFDFIGEMGNDLHSFP